MLHLPIIFHCTNHNDHRLGPAQGVGGWEALTLPPCSAGVHGMAWYRIYIISNGNQLVSDTNAECSSDQEACVLAERLLGPGAQAELWKRTKLVRVLSLAMIAE